jgi:hypothetical protein
MIELVVELPDALPGFILAHERRSFGAAMPGFLIHADFGCRLGCASREEDCDENKMGFHVANGCLSESRGASANEAPLADSYELSAALR